MNSRLATEQSPPPWTKGAIQRTVCCMFKKLRLTLAVTLTVAGFGAVGGCGKGTIWSTKQEVQIGKEAQVEVEHHYRVDTTSADATRVRRIGERLLPHTDQRPGVPYSFAVLDEKTVNAVSLPGGPVYVFRGLL